MSDELVILEMTYTDFEDSCGDKAVDETGDLRECRRMRGHRSRDPRHASNYPLTYWEDVPDV